MTNESSDLSFDRAAYETNGAGGDPNAPPCGNCGGPLGDTYWKWQQMIVCAACRPILEGALAKSQSPATFAKAAALGTATALGCGAAYAVFAHVAHMHVALVTIGIAYVIAKVIRKASGGVSGLRYQLLAVALAYVAGTMGYLPQVFGDVASYSIVQVILGIGLMLGAPLLTITSAPLGVLIIGFGLWEAWKLTKGVPPIVEGPFRVATPAAAAPL